MIASFDVIYRWFLMKYFVVVLLNLLSLWFYSKDWTITSQLILGPSYPWHYSPSRWEYQLHWSCKEIPFVLIWLNSTTHISIWRVSFLFFSFLFSFLVGGWCWGHLPWIVISLVNPSWTLRNLPDSSEHTTGSSTFLAKCIFHYLGNVLSEVFEI